MLVVVLVVSVVVDVGVVVIVATVATSMGMLVVKNPMAILFAGGAMPMQHWVMVTKI